MTNDFEASDDEPIFEGFKKRNIIKHNKKSSNTEWASPDTVVTDKNHLAATGALEAEICGAPEDTTVIFKSVLGNH